MLTLLLHTRCSKEPELNVKNPNKPKETPDNVSETLVLLNSTLVTGGAPSAGNSNLVRSNTKDTIYAIPGVKIPLRFSHPASRKIKGIYVWVKQASVHYDVPISREEESDTVSVVILDINPGNIVLPYDIPVDIIPYDDGHTPMDVLERIISVEKTAEPGCDILVPRPSTLGDTSGTWSPEWFWFATLVFNPNDELTFLNAPGNSFITQTNYEGCCDPNRPQGKCHPLSTTLNANVRAQIAYTIESETFTFFTNGTFARQTYERKQNFNPETTDWCAGIAGYTLSNSLVTYLGSHDYVPGRSTISYGTNYASCDLCGYGSRGGNLTSSCHLLVITRGVDFAKEVRMYVRNSFSSWYD